MSTVYEYQVGTIIWRYILSGTSPDEVASIGNGTAINGNATNLGTDLSGEIIIPSNVGTLNYPVRQIRSYAFSSCSSLKTVSIPDSVTTIDQIAFFNCTGLTSLTLPDSVTYIGQQAFQSCTGLTSVTMSKSISIIRQYTFYGCIMLASINIPSSVTTIATQSFTDTSANLTITMNTQTISGTVYTSPSTTDIAFFGNPSVTLVVPPPPEMTITTTTVGVANGSTNNNANIALTFTSNASTSDFDVGDIDVSGGTLSFPLNGSGNVYTSTFTPNRQGVCTINVAANKFTAAGKNNVASNTFTWTFDSVSPSMTITTTTVGVTNGSTTNNESIELTFTPTEPINGFAEDNITVTNGTLSPLTGNGSVYTATFTPTSHGECTINVAANGFADAAGNNNIATSFAWTFARTVQFNANTLTIVKSIDTNTTDVVLFVLPAGYETANMNVTSFTGTGTVTYTLAKSGATDITGTFSAIGANLLSGNLLFATADTNYTLTLTADAAITYTIIMNIDYVNTMNNPTPLTFVNNALTVKNDISATDIDIVSFQLPARSILYSFNVTNLLNANSITYSLDISGGANVSSGTITTTGVNLLGGNNLTPAVDTTYILNLTSSSTNTYTIIGKMLGPGYTLSSVISAGGMFAWNSDDTTNRLKQSYVKDFIDISGSLVLRNNANLYVEGNTTVNGKLLLNATNLQADLSFNNRILVGSDMSVNGNATIANDVSLNGVVTGCIFNNNSIPTSAFVNPVTVESPDYTKASVIYQQKFRANGDVSMNGSTVQATNITVNGNIEFNDGTKMSTYDDNKTVSLAGATYDSSLNNTTYLAPQRWMAGSEGGQYLYMVTGSFYATTNINNVNPNGAYNATTNTGAFYRSSDYGVNWTKITIPGSNDYYTGGVDSSTTGQHVIVGTHVWSTGTVVSTRDFAHLDTFYVSNDYGVSWRPYNMNTLAASGNERLAGVSMSATGQYMSVMPYGSPAIYTLYSIDNGVNWTKKNAGYGEFNFILNATLMLMSADGRYVYGGKTGMNRLDLSNNSFTNILTTFRDWTPNCSACSKKSTLMAFSLTNTTNTIDGDIYVCTDGVNVATKTVSATNKHQSKRVYIDYNDYIYVTIINKCYVSTDAGNTWTEVTLSPAIPSNITINYIYVTPKYIFTGEGTLRLSGNGAYLPDIVVYKKYIRQTLFKASTFSGLTIKGTLTAGTFVPPSDYRIKTNVAKLDNTFTIDNLRPVKYWQTLINKQQYGLIAHELQQYYPDLVIGEKDAPDLQRVNYTGLIAILINEINQLKRVVAEQEKKRQIAQSNQHT